MAMNMCLSIITLNVNGLNAPIERHRVAKWIRAYNPHMLSTRDLPQNKRCIQAESEGMEKNIPCKWT